MLKLARRSIFQGFLVATAAIALVGFGVGAMIVKLVHDQSRLADEIEVTMAAARYGSRAMNLADELRTNMYKAAFALRSPGSAEKPVLKVIGLDNAEFGKRVEGMTRFDLTPERLADLRRVQEASVRFHDEITRVAAAMVANPGAADEDLAQFDAVYNEVRPLRAMAFRRLEAEQAALDAHSERTANTIVYAIIGGGCLIILAFAGLIGFVYRGMVGPVRRIVLALGGEAGASEQDIDRFARRHDEVGILAATLVAQRHKAIEHERMEAHERERLQLRADKQLRMAQLVDGLRAAVGDTLDSVADQMQRMLFAADQLSRVASGAKSETAAATEASMQTTAHLGSVLQTTEELSITARDVGRQIAQVTGAVERANTLSLKANDGIASLAATTNVIGNVIGLIRGIAEQTNLLALNATIEAARAGEAGRGFAVVAGEVKALASQTASATEEIARHIVSVQASTAATVEQTRDIASAIGALHQAATSISAAVEQQSIANSQIAQDMNAVSITAQSLARSVGEAGLTIGAASDAAEDMRDIARDINTQSNALRGSIERFLHEVAA